MGQNNTINLSVFFDTDESRIKSEELNKLIQLWDSLEKDSILQIYLVGHTDNRADSLYNIDLSKRRCDEVRNFFASKNVDPKILKLNYYGEDRPASPNNTDQGKERNRRVDIRVVYVPKTPNSNFEDTIIQVKDTCTGIDTSITLEDGTEVLFNRCEYNVLKECLQIKSIRTTDELRQANMGLQTDNDIPLITCGMISICLKPDCQVKMSCFDYPVKVRFPFPGDNDQCLPCARREARIFNVNSGGQWVAANARNEKIEIVRSGGIYYYQMEIKCPNCGGMKNCDCPRCPTKKKDRRKVCPRVKIKLPAGYRLISAQIFVDCPATILNFSPKKGNFTFRHNIGKTYTKCYTSEKRIRVLAINPKGDTVQVIIQPLENIKHRILFSRCKQMKSGSEGRFETRKRAMYRKYVIKIENFSPT